MRVALLACGLALGGCGQTSRPPAPAPTPTLAAAIVPVVATPGPGALHADVSPLRGEISGFSVRTTGLSTIVALDADILFDFDKASLRPDASVQLGKAADTIRQGGAGDITILGYTDAKGSHAYNLDLSRRRAESVAAWMRAQPGVLQRSFDVVGKGEADPVAPNARPDGGDDPAGRAKNRRVEIVIPRA